MSPNVFKYFKLLLKTADYSKGGSESFYFVINRLQTFPGPGDYTHQHPPSQTRYCLATRPSAGPPPQQPQSCHPQLHPAEPGSDLRLQPRKQLHCPPDSRVCQQHPTQPAAWPTGSAAERHGLHQTCVPCANPAVCKRATSGSVQCATGREQTVLGLL